MLANSKKFDTQPPLILLHMMVQDGFSSLYFQSSCTRAVKELGEQDYVVVAAENEVLLAILIMVIIRG
jgi:hypothetical protein